MPLLDFFSNPNVALAAGLLSPTPNKNFGQGLLQGINAGQGVRQSNSQDQLAQLRAQIHQRNLDMPHFTEQKRAPHFTMTPGARGALTFNSRTNEMEFKPYPEGFGGPVAQNIPHQRSLAEQRQIGLGGAEAVTDPTTAAATITAKHGAQKEVDRPQREAAVASTAAKADMVSASIDQAIDQSGLWTAGFLGSASSWIPGTPAYDLSNTLGTVRANIGFDKLRELKEAGGTLGQVSDRENVLLQQVWGSVEQAQSPKQLKENLEKVRTQVKASWNRVNDAYKAEYGERYKGSANPPTPEDVPQEVWDAMTPEERALWQ